MSQLICSLRHRPTRKPVIPVASSCVARAKLTVRTFPTNRRSASGPWASRRERSLIKQREEQCYRCSLIYKVARFMAVRRRRPLFQPPRPRRNRDIPAKGKGSLCLLKKLHSAARSGLEKLKLSKVSPLRCVSGIFAPRQRRAAKMTGVHSRLRTRTLPRAFSGWQK